MFKKIVLFALLLIPVGVMAQEVKLAHVNSMEIVMAMPEFADMQTQLQNSQASFEKEMKIMEDEYTKKYEAFMAEGDTLVEAIQKRRLQEIQDLEQRAQTFAQQQQKQMQDLRDQLFLPIQEKVQAALKAVGDANNFTYIMDVSGSGVIVYANPNSTDATPLVKKQLGIQ